MVLPQEIIALKRDGQALKRAQIEAFVQGVVDGSFKDYQAAALLMAILLNGMDAEETACLTESMMRSGRVLQLHEIDRPKVDKHSTGGVGDKVSLILAPLAAACGLCVPMMSGRGLGHTGGTLDKLESIDGFNVYLSEAEFRAQLQTLHTAMIGQSSEMVPADRILYGLRDVTATVESIPLICSSILSKKMAEGIDALVLDVKCGRGAFMKTEADARELAGSLVRICEAMGRRASALISRMDAPLGFAVGNALEVIEAIECLKGRGPADLMEITYALTARMLELGGIVSEEGQARELMADALDSGSALEFFRGMVEAQGGDALVIDDYSRLPRAAELAEYRSESDGYVAGVDARLVGEAVCLLGAGRQASDDTIDPSAGIVLKKKPGDSVSRDECLCCIYYNDTARYEEALQRLEGAFAISTEPVEAPALIIDSL
ncbi:thymidine phosphorylase [Coraliomargarita parva]|uniref:thymidine phosphorylase n=1 Tax=Coraliomargarita parva TaxID=3014050 RepID=UPI0022B3BEDB|nr:thymidine phosphorylase [Coraliomargarita parva]